MFTHPDPPTHTHYYTPYTPYTDPYTDPYTPYTPYTRLNKYLSKYKVFTCGTHPVSAVFTAVSTSPSRPPMVWKKNSGAVRPLKKLVATKGTSEGVCRCAGVQVCEGV